MTNAIQHRCKSCNSVLFETDGPIAQTTKIRCRKCKVWNQFEVVWEIPGDWTPPKDVPVEIISRSFDEPQRPEAAKENNESLRDDCSAGVM